MKQRAVSMALCVLILLGGLSGGAFAGTGPKNSEWNGSAAPCGRIIIDEEAPMVSISSPANGSTLDDATTDISGFASDNVAVSVVEVSQSGIAWSPANGTKSWTYENLTLPEGISTVYARATDGSGNRNITWITLAYVPGGGNDTHRPEIAITSPANGTILDHATFNLSGTASDDFAVAKVEVSLSAISWWMASGTESWTYAGLTIGEGINTVYARATDYAGNSNITWITLSYVPGGANDTARPHISITSPSDGSTLDHSTFNLSGTASDDFGVAKVEVSLSGIVWTMASGTDSWTYAGFTIGEGGNTVFAKATDFAGNFNTTSITIFYMPPGANDTRIPNITINAPANWSTVNTSSVNLAGTASDDTGLAKVEVSLSGIAWELATGTDSWAFSGLILPVGVSTVYARATDISGKTAAAWITLSYEPASLNDTTRPQILITSPANGSTLSNATFTLSGTASDENGVFKVEVSLSAISWWMATGTTSWSYPGLTIGTGISTIYARATDVAGNTNLTWITLAYVPAGGNDTVKPQVAITSPASGAVLSSSTFNLAGTASDNYGVFKVEASLSGIVWWMAVGTTSWSYPGLAVGEGGNTVWVRATDYAGNFNITSRFVFYIPGGDTMKPNITVASLKDGAKVTKSRLATLTGSVSDNSAVKKVELTVNGATVPAAFANGVWTATNITLKEGKNTIVVSATDIADNTQAKTVTVTYEKAKAQPGFEALFLVAAVVVGLVILKRRRT